RQGGRERSAKHVRNVDGRARQSREGLQLGIASDALGCAPMSALRSEQAGDVLRLTMSRPEQRIAFDAALIQELTEAFSDIGDVRAVVLAGEGKSFSAGADVEWMRAA